MPAAQAAAPHRAIAIAIAIATGKLTSHRCGPRLVTFHHPPMDNLTFGLTMLIVGMGGTMLTLWLLAILIGWLTKLCQPRTQRSNHE